MPPMPNDLESLVGEQMMIGVAGPKMTPAMRKQIRRIRPGGVIFFRPNFSSAKNFRKLVSDLEDAAEKRLVTAVDHEGGRVIHLAGGVTVFPDNLVIGNTKKNVYPREQGRIEALELRRLGITLNLAPTIDVLRENFSPNIGIRSYGKDPDLVASFGAERIKALQTNGVAACAKHFPGQGQSNRDAHLDLPVLFSSNDEMEKIHLAPFRAAVQAGVASVMTSHPIYPNLDKSRRPATFSKEVIRLLRSQLGFQGAILTDDLEMGALKGICPIGESAVRSIEAGHDMVLVCHDLKAQIEVYENLLKAYSFGKLDRWALEKSLVRIERLRKKNAGAAKPVSFAKSRALAAKICAEGVRRSSQHAGFRFKKGKTVSAVFPAVSELAGRIFIEKEMLDEKAYVKKLLSAAGWKAGQIVIPGLKASAGDLAKIKKLEGNVVFFCFDAHLDEGTRKLLKEIQKNNTELAVVLLRDPYDIDFVEKNAACVSVFGFRDCQIRAGLEMLA